MSWLVKNMNKIERMKITGIILLFLFNLLGVVPSMGQTQEEKVYSKIDLMYNVLNQKDKATLPAEEYSKCFDEVDLAVMLMIDSLPTDAFKAKAELVAYKNVMNTLGLYVDRGGKDLVKKYKKRLKGIRYEVSFYRRITLYI